MMTITSEAGRRLAIAKAELDEAEEEDVLYDARNVQIARWKFDDAARAVADELVAQGFHDTESRD